MLGLQPGNPLSPLACAVCMPRADCCRHQAAGLELGHRTEVLQTINVQNKIFKSRSAECALTAGVGDSQAPGAPLQLRGNASQAGLGGFSCTDPASLHPCGVKQFASQCRGSLVSVRQGAGNKVLVLGQRAAGGKVPPAAGRQRMHGKCCSREH